MNVLEKSKIDEIDQVEKEAFSIKDLSSANWALSKINVLEKQNEEIATLAEQEREKIDEWERKETQSNKDSIEYFQQKLSEYLAELRKENPKAKISTPSGVVSTRKNQPRWEYTADAIEEFESKGLSDFVRIKKEVDKSAIKKAFVVLENGAVVSENGELIESIKVTEQGETVTFKTK